MGYEWRLFWVGDGVIPLEVDRPRLGGLAERERALGLRERQPIPVAPAGRVDPRLNEYLRRSAFSAKAQGAQVTYAPLYRLFFTFLWQRGLDWRGIGGRRRGLVGLGGLASARGDEPGAGRGRHVGEGAGGVEAAVRYRRQARSRPAEPDDARPAVGREDLHVKWLSPRAFRLWRNVGLDGMLPSGEEDEPWRGRSVGRDAAYADLMYSSGLRRRP
ncbi:hypothetical protein [Streptomyces tsukubensis]|uniref:hypothetical protein n=1 Tax=Streptomyces tsukubensis TaxID=83656 RepID=UPI003450134E